MKKVQRSRTATQKHSQHTRNYIADMLSVLSLGVILYYAFA